MRTTRMIRLIHGFIASLLVIAVCAVVNAQLKPGRDPNQPVDEEYTNKIREYTTETFFNSPLTDYLPASATVPTPMSVLGNVAGSPGKLPYVEEVYRYMRLLEKASPRVKVYSIGTTEEGREMIAVAVASDQLLTRLDENRARLAKLADPRAINLNDDEADKLVAASFPIYYITGTIHSTETGSPTALMELAYRLAVDDSAYVKSIRDNVVTLITPVVEVDGRNRMVDIYNWHLQHPSESELPLMYWGHYVAHDNNRDAIGLSLKLTRNVLNTFTGWKAQVLHDLHESVPYLYDNTVGDGPYNAWFDPILTYEWQMIGWNNVSEMTKFGMPGVFAHGNFDTWSPGYLMFIAATHNGISRLYETFGNRGADTLERTLSPSEYQRTWYRQNPPLPKAKWSQRNNNNYQQTALLTSLYYFGNNSKLFLKNFYLKSKRSVLKPRNEGPAAYVLPGDDPRPGNQAELLRTLQGQGVEIHRATAPFTVSVKPKKKSAPPAVAGGSPLGASASATASPSPSPTPASAETTGAARTFPAGSYIVRMDQPYSRIADALLDYQYWAPNDPQPEVYDDTAWTMGELANVGVFRIVDTKVLDAPMNRVSSEIRAPGSIIGLGSTYLVNHNADNALVTLRYQLKDASVEVAEEPFEVAGQKFNRGSFIIRKASADDMRPGLGWSGLMNLQKFVQQGGVFLSVDDTANFAVNYGFTPGISIARASRLRAVGDILRMKTVDATSPIAYGYADSLAMYCSNGPIFNLSNMAGGTGGRRRADQRVTGRGTPDDPDTVQGRPPVEIPEAPKAEVWEALPLTDEQRHNNAVLVIPPGERPRVVMRYADLKDLFVSGLLDGGDEIAEHAAVIDVPSGRGHVVVFSTNPMWRGQTKGSYFLVFNAILNFDNLNAGRKLE